MEQLEQVDNAQTRWQIQAIVGEVIGTSVTTTATLMSAGLDSIAATEFARTLSEQFNAELPSTLLFDHPTIDAIATYMNPMGYRQSRSKVEANTRELVQQEPIGQGPEVSVRAWAKLPPSSTIAGARGDFDAVVVGAGVVGLCFARDLASLGYRVAIIERRASMGGVWSENDYPGLRLHGPGAVYRSLSLAP